MIENVKKDIINVLNETIDAIKQEKYFLLKEISDHTIHNSTIIQDPDSINTAILVYSLYKIFKNKQNERTIKKILEELKAARDALINDDLAKFNQSYKNIFHAFELNKDLKENIQYVINEAKIKKGSKIIYHGLSISRASELLGISQWELMKYLGNVNMFDNFNQKISPITRLNNLKKEIEKK
ncbi:MAG: hypothetical protein QXS41_00015 [Candidatus Woesearchaeota archaeon]